MDENSLEDLDLDGLTNKQEKEYKTDPELADSDLDGLDDNAELGDYQAVIVHPEEGATAGIFIGLSVFTFTIVAVFGFYFFLGTFGNPIVANTIVVSKWSISKLHRVILAQENSKKICYNIME